METAKTTAVQQIAAKCRESLTFYLRVYVYSDTLGMLEGSDP
jgi:hypothetical protein